jgi:hypothetical protein
LVACRCVATAERHGLGGYTLQNLTELQNLYAHGVLEQSLHRLTTFCLPPFSKRWPERNRGCMHSSVQIHNRSAALTDHDEILKQKLLRSITSSANHKPNTNPFSSRFPRLLELATICQEAHHCTSENLFQSIDNKTAIIRKPKCQRACGLRV